MKSPTSTISLVWFSKLRGREVEVEESLVNLIVENKIPQELFAPTDARSIDFAGRKVPTLGGCYFTGINIMQCPYNGEMNWGIYRTLGDAQRAVADQFAASKQRKVLKPIKEEEVEVLFEEAPTKAKRVVFDIKGVASALTGMLNAKTLTAYYVAQVVRNHPIACMMSF